MSLGIPHQQAAGCFECAVISDAGEDIQNLPLRGKSILHAVCGEQGKPERSGDLNGALIERLLLSREMALQLDVNTIAAENFNETLGNAPAFVNTIPAD